MWVGRKNETKRRKCTQKLTDKKEEQDKDGQIGYEHIIYMAAACVFMASVHGHVKVCVYI